MLLLALLHSLQIDGLPVLRAALGQSVWGDAAARDQLLLARILLQHEEYEKAVSVLEQLLLLGPPQPHMAECESSLAHCIASLGMTIQLPIAARLLASALRTLTALHGERAMALLPTLLRYARVLAMLNRCAAVRSMRRRACSHVPQETVIWQSVDAVVSRAPSTPAPVLRAIRHRAAGGDCTPALLQWCRTFERDAWMPAQFAELMCAELQRFRGAALDSDAQPAGIADGVDHHASAGSQQRFSDASGESMLSAASSGDFARNSSDSTATAPSGMPPNVLARDQPPLAVPATPQHKAVSIIRTTEI